ncbi:MAG: penicillin-binding transpeptidase domain-containing protein [Clostridia bacterium]
MAYITVKNNKRIAIMLVVCSILIIVLILRLIYIQVIRSDHYSSKAYEQQTRERLITPKRGTIYDRSYEKVLTKSISTSKITIIPASVKNKEEVGKKLSEILELNIDEVMSKLNKKSSQETIYTKLDADKTSKVLKYISENDVEGIKVDEDTKRIYPYSEMLSHTLGFVGTDNQGLSGIEAMYEKELKGVPGKIVGSIDGKGRETPFTNEQYIAPKDGSNLILTIDATIQAITEKYLKKAFSENLAKEAYAVVMKPSTGEVLAIANYPTFDLNTPFTPNTDELKQKWETLSSKQRSDELQHMWRNKVISDSYEPGSTFKIVTAMAALEENITEIDTPNVFNCTGSMKVSDWVIKCWRFPRSHGLESLRQGLMNSCNTSMMQAASKVGIENYYKYLDALNLPRKTGIDLPGETNGIIHQKDKMTTLDLATTSFGQTIQITTLQTAVNYCSVANGGYLIEPFVVKEIKSKDSSFQKKTDAKVIKQIVSKSTASDILSALEDTVKTGTGKAAQVRGYRVAGKTATAEIGRGTGATYMAGFAGIAPVNNPELVVVINILDPKGPSGHQGSTLCAPVVGSIIDETLRYLDIKPEYDIAENNIKEKIVPSILNITVEEATKILSNNGFKLESDDTLKSTDIIKSQIPEAGASLMENSIVRGYINNNPKQTVPVPDIRNKSSDYSKKTLNKLGLNVRILGNGYVLTQDPSPGSVIEKGSIVTIKCVDTMDLP